MEYRIFRDLNYQWRWRLVAANGKILANCGEGYHNKSDCLHDIGLVKLSTGAPVKEL